MGKKMTEGDRICVECLIGKVGSNELITVRTKMSIGARMGLIAGQIVEKLATNRASEIAAEKALGIFEELKSDRPLRKALNYLTGEYDRKFAKATAIGEFSLELSERAEGIARDALRNAMIADHDKSQLDSLTFEPRLEGNRTEKRYGREMRVFELKIK